MGFSFGFINGVSLGFEFYGKEASTPVAPGSSGALCLELLIIRIIIFKY